MLARSLVLATLLSASLVASQAAVAGDPGNLNQASRGIIIQHNSGSLVGLNPQPEPPSRNANLAASRGIIIQHRTTDFVGLNPQPEPPRPVGTLSTGRAIIIQHTNKPSVRLNPQPEPPGSARTFRSAARGSGLAPEAQIPGWTGTLYT